MKLATVKPRNVRKPHFSDFWFRDFPVTAKPSHVNTSPAVNILEFDDHFEIHLAVPGQKKTDFEIGIEDDSLRIELKEKESSSKDVKFTKREFNYAPFLKSYKLSDIIDQGSIDASYTNGILIVNLSKKEEAKKQKPRAITIL